MKKSAIKKLKRGVRFYYASRYDYVKDRWDNRRWFLYTYETVSTHLLGEQITARMVLGENWDVRRPRKIGHWQLERHYGSTPREALKAALRQIENERKMEKRAEANRQKYEIQIGDLAHKLKVNLR